MNMNLEEIREKIDLLDQQIVALLTQRLEVTKEVAEYKLANNLPIYHPQREAKVIEKVTSYTPPEYAAEMAAIYQCIMEQSKHNQVRHQNKRDF